jgi:hypothetical protein
MRKRLDQLPQTGLLSDSLWTRAWTVWGHMLVPQLLVGLVVYLLVLLLIAGTRR